MTGEGSAAASPLVQSTLLGELLENADVGAVAIDTWRCVAANAYACELTGYDRSELIGKHIGELNAIGALPDQRLEAHVHERDVAIATIRRKDRAELDVVFRAFDTALSGLPLVLTLFELF